MISVSSARLSWLPVALFGSVMGLAGLGQAWRMAHTQWGTPLWIAQIMSGVAVIVFVLLVVAYAIKAATGFEHVKAEFTHPIAGALFGTPLISALLLPAILAEISMPLARTLWILGAIGMTVFAWLMAVRWIGIRQQRVHAVPAWIVPLVGMLDIPLAVPALHFTKPPHALMVLGLSVGLFFAIPLFTIILSRLMFEEPMPAAMSPSLLIMLAPFAVGFSAYVITVGHVDLFAEGLFALTLLLLTVLLSRLRDLRHCCPFRVSWWAVSFPLSAAAGAGLRYAAFAQAIWADAIAVALLALATTVIAALFIRTITGIVRGEMQKLAG
ncbi:SLAC1 anion channel family protein [Serratia proteamaculans]|uniref:SLAC1 anion channel family protein n=1 Tax=Serratia proteamaculans TaxID=28151 RepID=A0A7U0N5P1_SERPR|nr:SLAC1 anion channel family protein [Serratia proteamaculans]MBO1501794.1 SLAC1 anion channel family protein [Serratia proteamaculans]MDW5508644.1 SLAC1 anion channel family protein [Serratia proteamaculans]QQX52976.1 SLAC1 anion channel family protein [Serratia proteamaculans]